MNGDFGKVMWQSVKRTWCDGEEIKRTKAYSSQKFGSVVGKYEEVSKQERKTVDRQDGEKLFKIDNVYTREECR